jgi:hypothetical protein
VRRASPDLSSVRSGVRKPRRRRRGHDIRQPAGAARRADRLELARRKDPNGSATSLICCSPRACAWRMRRARCARRTSSGARWTRPCSRRQSRSRPTPSFCMRRSAGSGDLPASTGSAAPILCVPRQAGGDDGGALCPRQAVQAPSPELRFRRLIRDIGRRIEGQPALEEPFAAPLSLPQRRKPAPLLLSGQKRGVFGVIKRELRRRSAIEAVIGHMKNEGHLGRCWLKGREGDAANVFLSAVGYNLRHVLAWLRAFLRLILNALVQALGFPSDAGRRGRPARHRLQHARRCKLAALHPCSGDSPPVVRPISLMHVHPKVAVPGITPGVWLLRRLRRLAGRRMAPA